MSFGETRSLKGRKGALATFSQADEDGEGKAASGGSGPQREEHG